METTLDDFPVNTDIASEAVQETALTTPEAKLLVSLEGMLPAISAAALEEVSQNTWLAYIQPFDSGPTTTLELYQSVMATIDHLRRYPFDRLTGNSG